MTFDNNRKRKECAIDNHNSVDVCTKETRILEETIRNTPTDQANVNFTLEQILNNLSKYSAISLTSIDLFQEMSNKLLEKQYHSVKDFKLDMDKLFMTLRSKCTVSNLQDIDSLYATVLSSILVEVRCLNIKDNEEKTIESILKPAEQIQQRTALFRSSLDGFVFTDANRNYIDINENYLLNFRQLQFIQ
ncbi:unnamed protein product [Cunninghamella echinulata]